MSGASRYRGPHSPGADAAAPDGKGQRRKPIRWSERAVRSPSFRITLLFFAPTFLLFGLIRAVNALDAGRMLWLGLAYALFLGGAFLTRTGMEAARAYEARAVARPPAFPRKLFGAGAIGLATALCTLRATASPLSALVFGAAAVGLHVVAFGIDPMRAKGLDGLDPEALDAAISRVATARALVADMTEAAARFEDPVLEAKVSRLAATASDVLARIEGDPRELRRARRFLAVYLVGARDATVQFAQSYDASGDAAIREKFTALLDDLEAQFTRHRDTLLQDNRTGLDVEIDVLRERLRQEGL